jgi:hypothetical protein
VNPKVVDKTLLWGGILLLVCAVGFYLIDPHDGSALTMLSSGIFALACRYLYKKFAPK